LEAVRYFADATNCANKCIRNFAMARKKYMNSLNNENFSSDVILP
jgi:hypothetical protein